MVLISELDNIIRRRIPQTKSGTIDYIVRKNIEYNIQYLEFLATYIFEKELNTVVRKLIAKNFLVTVFSIIEGVLTYELQANDLIGKEEWEEVASIKSNPKEMLGFSLKTETLIYKKIDRPVKYKSLSFKQKLDIAQNHKIFGRKPEVYKELCRINKLRNTIHLHTMDKVQATDYNRFNCIEFENIKAVFLGFLKFYFAVTSKEIQEYFKFLLPISYN